MAVLPAGRQDRRPRPERRGQVDAAEDHGRPRRRLHPRSLGRGGRHGRLPGAGAADRIVQHRTPVGWGKGEAVSVTPGGRRTINIKKKKENEFPEKLKSLK